ncbi:MAG: tyrosine--tRNA ligase [bacterium]
MSASITKFLSRGIDTVISKQSLEKKLASEKKLRAYFGIDPSGSDLHLGHAVPLKKLREIQDLGHTAILLIGDYTGKIGDPTGKSHTRNMLTTEQIEENMKNYLQQAGKILDISTLEIRYNSEWYKDLSFDEILKITSAKTVAQFLQREDFKNRFKEGRDISLVEFLYPLMQGYDSVVLKVDIQIGGTDQLFNMLVGRDIQEFYGQPPLDVITVPILEGLDGKEKMSKSLNNYIGITEEPKEVFGKTMSIPDELIIRYFELASTISTEEIEQHKQNLNNGTNPRDIKIALAKQLIQQYHSQEAAEQAHQAFIQQFQKNEIPDDIPEIVINHTTTDIITLLVECQLCSSRSDARRMIDQKAVSLNKEKIVDENHQVIIEHNQILQVGKRKFCRIINTRK